MSMAGHPELVTGVNLGVPFPTFIEGLIERGAEFLTSALRAAGALWWDNRVSALTRGEEFVGGGAGRKLWLSVEYERADPELHRELFVKMPRDFGDYDPVTSTGLLITEPRPRPGHPRAARAALRGAARHHLDAPTLVFDHQESR